MSSPACWTSFRSLLRMDNILALAFAVVAKLINEGCIFCDFEDQLNRKKVPIDFSLGNSKY